MTVALRRPSVVSALGGEVLKLSRQLSVWLMLGGALVLLAVTVLATTTAQNFHDALGSNPSLFVNDLAEVYGTVFQVGSGLFLLIVSARLVAMEYSAGTIRVLYARGVGRLQLLLTKVAALLVLGWLVLAGYLLLVAAIALVLVRAWAGSLAPLGQVSGEEWQNVERAIGFFALNVVVLVVIGAAAAAAGRSLAFALAAALALFPADNFLSVILMIVASATRHQHPWLDINQWFLGPNLNEVLPLWLTTHPRAAFAEPAVHVNLTHCVAVIAAWTGGLATLAVVRTVRPDVLE